MPEERIRAAVRIRLYICDNEDCKGIMSYLQGALTQDNDALLRDGLEISGVFEDKDGEEEAGVTDALNRMLRLLNEALTDAIELVIARAIMDLVELCDEEW